MNLHLCIYGVSCNAYNWAYHAHAVANAMHFPPCCHANTHMCMQIALLLSVDSMPCTFDAKEPNSALHAEEHRKHACCDAYFHDLLIFVVVVERYIHRLCVCGNMHKGTHVLRNMCITMV